MLCTTYIYMYCSANCGYIHVGLWEPFGGRYY